MNYQCDMCGKHSMLGNFLRCDKCMKKTSQKTCPHTEILSHWLYEDEKLLKASGFCQHCGIDFKLPITGEPKLVPLRNNGVWKP